MNTLRNNYDRPPDAIGGSNARKSLWVPIKCIFRALRLPRKNCDQLVRQIAAGRLMNTYAPRGSDCVKSLPPVKLPPAAPREMTYAPRLPPPPCTVAEISPLGDPARQSRKARRGMPIRVRLTAAALAAATLPVVIARQARGYDTDAQSLRRTQRHKSHAQRFSLRHRSRHVFCPSHRHNPFPAFRPERSGRVPSPFPPTGRGDADPSPAMIPDGARQSPR